MGLRKCAAEGCNALEFRTEGWCQKHRVDNTPLPSKVKDILPPESTILTQTTTSQETPIVVENPPSRYRFLAIFFLFIGVLFFPLSFHGPPEFEGPISFLLGIGCLVSSLLLEKYYRQQSKIAKTKLGESTKSETNAQTHPFTLILVGLSTLLLLLLLIFILPVLLFILSHF